MIEHDSAVELCCYLGTTRALLHYRCVRTSANESLTLGIERAFQTAINSIMKPSSVTSTLKKENFEKRLRRLVKHLGPDQTDEHIYYGFQSDYDFG